MNEGPINLNKALFIGIDAHPTTHTALAMNRFEEQKGLLTFDNTEKELINFSIGYQPLKNSQSMYLWVLKEEEIAGTH